MIYIMKIDNYYSKSMKYYSEPKSAWPLINQLIELYLVMYTLLLLNFTTRPYFNKLFKIFFSLLALKPFHCFFAKKLVDREKTESVVKSCKKKSLKHLPKTHWQLVFKFGCKIFWK